MSLSLGTGPLLVRPGAPGFKMFGFKGRAAA